MLIYPQPTWATNIVGVDAEKKANAGSAPWRRATTAEVVGNLAASAVRSRSSHSTTKWGRIPRGDQPISSLELRTPVAPTQHPNTTAPQPLMASPLPHKRSTPTTSHQSPPAPPAPPAPPLPNSSGSALNEVHTMDPPPPPSSVYIYIYIYVIYTPNRELRIAGSVPRREHGRFRGSTERARGAPRVQEGALWGSARERSRWKPETSPPAFSLSCPYRFSESLRDLERSGEFCVTVRIGSAVGCEAPIIAGVCAPIGTAARAKLWS